MTNDDLTTVRTFIDSNAPSIVKDAFDIICKDIAEALKPSHNSAMDATCDTIECPDCGAEFSVDCECPICKGHWLRHKQHQ